MTAILASDTLHGWTVVDPRTNRTLAGPTWSLAELEREANQLGIRIERRTP